MLDIGSAKLSDSGTERNGVTPADNNIVDSCVRAPAVPSWRENVCTLAKVGADNTSDD